MARHVKSGDTVRVIAGESKGEVGKVLRVLTSEDKVIVEGINIRKKHVRRSQEHPQGGRIEREMPIHISNVQPVSPSAKAKDGKPAGTRVRFENRPDGSKVRVAVKGGDVLSVLRKAR